MTSPSVANHSANTAHLVRSCKTVDPTELTNNAAHSTSTASGRLAKRPVGNARYVSVIATGGSAETRMINFVGKSVSPVTRGKLRVNARLINAAEANNPMLV